MNASTFEKLEYHIIGRLTQVGLLAGILEELLGEHATSRRKVLDAISTNPLLRGEDLADVAAKRGYRTISDIKKLYKVDPELATNIGKQLQLKIQEGSLSVEFRLYSSIYPSIALSSLAIMAFAVFEQSVALICSALAEMQHVQLTLADLAGHGTLDKAQRYFSKVLGFKIDFARSSHWQQVKGHQHVRNLLVHNGGILDDSERSERIVKFARRRRSGLSIEAGMLQLEKLYVEQVANDAQLWLIDLFDGIKKHSKSLS